MGYNATVQYCILGGIACILIAAKLCSVLREMHIKDDEEKQ